MKTKLKNIIANVNKIIETSIASSEYKSVYFFIKEDWQTLKVEFICGECGKYNSKRAYTANCYNGVELACDSCGTINDLPICMR